MLFGWVRVTQDHLDTRMPEHRCKSNQVDPGHGSASRPSVTKIVESKVWNRTLVCFRSDSVDSRQRADVRGVHLNDRLVGCATGKDKIAFHFLKPSSQERTSPFGERDFASDCLCLSERVEEIALV